MTWFEAVIYGVIQGLSEFLPVSSSGHLALLPHVMKIQDPGVIFDLMMHFGTALGVITYFRKDILQYARVLDPSLVNFKVGTPQQWFVRNFITATFTSIFFIVLFIPVSKLARDPYIIVFNLVCFGALLWFADYKNSKSTTLEAPMEQGMQWRLTMIIGAAQAVAIFPGVSRSGITLTAALLLGMKRKEAGAFSFLLSLPIIIAGIFKEIPELVSADPERINILLIGITTSFIVGFLTIHFFMKVIGSIKLMYFSIYRWIIAGVMVWILS